MKYAPHSTFRRNSEEKNLARCHWKSFAWLHGRKTGHSQILLFWKTRSKCELRRKTKVNDIFRHSMTTWSNIHYITIKERITKDKMSWCLNKKLRKKYKKASKDNEGLKCAVFLFLHRRPWKGQSTWSFCFKNKERSCYPEAVTSQPETTAGFWNASLALSISSTFGSGLRQGTQLRRWRTFVCPNFSDGSETKEGRCALN